jgi:hypothetical protein
MATPDYDEWTKVARMYPGLYARVGALLDAELKNAGATRGDALEADLDRAVDALRASDWRCYARGKQTGNPRDKVKEAVRVALHRAMVTEGLEAISSSSSAWISARQVLAELLREGRK